MVVRDSEGDFDLIAGSIAARLEPRLSAPLSINSGLDLREITFVLDLSSERLQEMAIEPIVPEVSSVMVTPDGGDRLHVRLLAAPGELLQGNRALALLDFSPGSSQRSEIVTLMPHTISAVRSSGRAVPAARGVNGRIVLIGREPLLLAEPGSPVTLKLFGIPERSYVLESAATVDLPPVWKVLLEYQQTNLTHTVPISGADLMLFYRMREK